MGDLAFLPDFTLLLSFGFAVLAYLTKYELTPAQKFPVDEIYPRDRIESDVSDEENPFMASDYDMLVLYGSQTGTAEKYSLKFCKEMSAKYGLKTKRLDIGDYEYSQLEYLDKVVCFFLATYGEGEPTDTAQEFFAHLNNAKRGKVLKGLKYIVFGLGNRSYTHFNKTAKDLDYGLAKMQAERLGPIGEGDDGARTMEEDYLEWKDNIIQELNVFMNLTEREFKYVPSIKVEEVGDPFPEHKAGSLVAQRLKVVTQRDLMESDDRRCVHLELELPAGSKLSYVTGDHLVMWPQNSTASVEKFLSTFGLLDKRHCRYNFQLIDNLKDAANIPQVVGEIPIDFYIRNYVDINGQCSREMLKTLASFAPTHEVKEELLRLTNDKCLYQCSIIDKQHTISSLLTEISDGQPWTDVPLSFLIETISPLQPRYYSTSSSSVVSPKTLSITCVVDNDRTVASNYLYSFVQPTTQYKSHGQLIPATIQRSTFKLPKNPSTPVIMIGPGTGVAPFRGFIQERYLQYTKDPSSTGPTILFFGCRKSHEDFLYKQELTSYPKEFLSLFTAFSRQTNLKVYVQSKMKEQSNLLRDLIKNQGARIYVCGNATSMAMQTQQAFRDILNDDQDMTYITHLKKLGMYQEDVW
jgi:NADPH-ferrihemoprotein reductase